MDRFELAWAAGFFDGEGWANAARRADRRTVQPHARVNQADPNGIPEVLLRFQRALGGLGRIGGPFVKDGREDLYRWEVSSRHDVELLHHLLLPRLGQVKLNEFADALGREPSRSRIVDSGEAWVAWCAGLFDGEGWASMWAHRSHVGYLSAEVGVGQSSACGRPEVLTRFAHVVGIGRIYGPYTQAGAKMPIYKFKVSAQGDIESVITTLHSRLSSVKRSDVDLVMEILHGQPPLPRGNPAWAKRGSRCPRGHEFETGRLRPYKPRGTGETPNAHPGCLICLREYAREQRRKKKEAGD